MKIATLMFTYNRPKHTYEVLEGLKNNTTLPEQLFIFHDGVKESTNTEAWTEVERVINSVKWCNCEVITSNTNKGLANSVISGVNHVLENFDAVIVLEDDCIPHKLFMEYMNKALYTYVEEKHVYSIGASAEPVEVPSNGYDAYFVGRINSCGWGTWKDRWEQFRRDYNLIGEIRKDAGLNAWLQVWGQDLEMTLHNNMRGLVDSWAAFWALSVMRHKGLSLSPYYSLIRNIGYDGSGRHSEVEEHDDHFMPNEKETINIPSEAKVINDYERIFADYYRWTEPGNLERYYKNVLLDWVDYIRQGKEISDWLLANNITNVCIWGLGEVGKKVISFLKNVVKIEAIIESTPQMDKYEDIKVVSYKDLFLYTPSIDGIIVIPGYDIERISKLVDSTVANKLIPVDKLFTPTLRGYNENYRDLCEHVGNLYGGYELATCFVPDSAVVYSFGIGEDISFDEEMRSRFDACIYAFDPTPKSKVFISKRSIVKDDKFSFYNYGLSDKNQNVGFYLPKNESHVSGSEYVRNELEDECVEVCMKDIGTIAKELGHTHVDVLKMDIEGSEFAVVDTLENYKGLAINQICLETHQRFFDDGIIKLEKMHDTLCKLGFVLIWASENYEELTYVKGELLSK